MENKKTITAIIQSYRRQENIPIIIKRLKEQTHPPSRIIVWNDNDGKGKDLYIDGIEIINTNSNEWHNCGSFLIAYFCTTDYICIIDDDALPGRRYFEFCLKYIGNEKQILSGFGIILRSNKYTGRSEVRSRVSNKLKFTKVDMAGNIYFFWKSAVLPMFTKRPPLWDHISDLHFSFMARKHGYKIYVPSPMSKEELPFSAGLPIGVHERAMYQVRGHFDKRNMYVKWAIENKIIGKVV